MRRGSVSVVRQLIDWTDLDLRPIGRNDAIPPPFEKMVFGFIDEAPAAGWSHPCRYVFFNEDLSQYAVLRMSEPPWRVLVPEKGGERPLPFWGTARGLTMEQTVGRVRSHIDRLKSAKRLVVANGAAVGVADAGSPSNSYFLVIAGGICSASNGSRFWADAAMYYSTLTLKYGVPKENIVLLVSDGGSDEKDAFVYVDNEDSREHCREADTNGDGLISFGEAFVFSVDNDICADPGYPDLYEEPQFAESAPGLGERFFTLRQAAGPTCEGGEIDWDAAANAWVVTPTNGAQSVTIVGLRVGAKVAVRCGGFAVPEGAFAGFGVGRRANVFSLALNPEGVVTIDGKLIPGLEYALWRGPGFCRAEGWGEIASRAADKTRVTLRDEDPPVDKAFYTISVRTEFSGL